MTFGERLRRYLPPFLRPGGAVTEAITQAMGTAMQELTDEAKLLRARGAANRFSGLFTDYYAGAERKTDVARVGMSRLLSKRANESWTEFEARVAAFVGLEVWDGSRTSYSALGDVAQWGTYTGLVREIERTGLVVDDIYAARSDGQRWRILSCATMGVTRSLNFSMILDVGTAKPEGQRLTKIYTYRGWYWIIWIVLADPDVVDYLADEIRDIVRAVKPAWVRAYVMFPGEETWEKVD